MSETKMVRVKVNTGHVYCEDEERREQVHGPGSELLIPHDRVNHCVTVLQPSIKGEDPDRKPQHRMIESPRGGGRK